MGRAHVAIRAGVKAGPHPAAAIAVRRHTIAACMVPVVGIATVMTMVTAGEGSCAKQDCCKKKRKWTKRPHGSAPKAIRRLLVDGGVTTPSIMYADSGHSGCLQEGEQGGVGDAGDRTSDAAGIRSVWEKSSLSPDP